ncbi:MAG: sialate O-acetylesterase [Akkermansia sp.]
MDIRFLLPFLAAALPLAAQPAFDTPFRDGMVLQREAKLTLRGSAAAGSPVSISWRGQQRETRADARGRWQLTLDTGAAATEGCTLRAQDREGSAELRDVLVGDVWLASGQSNMEFPLGRSTGGAALCEAIQDPALRLLRVRHLLPTGPGSYSPEQYRAAEQAGFFRFEWVRATPEQLRDFSAVAAVFAHELRRAEAGVPIGIICNAVGGSGMESWTPRRVIERAPLYARIRGERWRSSPDYDAWMRGRAEENLRRVREAGIAHPLHAFAPAVLYEHAVAPLTALPIKGVIWYQGESNAEEPDTARNTTRLRLLIAAWRKAFGQEALPFIMVQLPRIADPKRPHWGAFRTVQKQVADALPGVELICTVDLGSTTREVHPPDKAPVGQRLAATALRCVYGKDSPRYPELRSAGRSPQGMLLRSTEPLRTTDGAPPRGFELADAPDAPFRPAEAELRGDTILLKGKGRVWRYCEGTALEPNLVGAESGLPVFPARSYGSAPAGSS